MSDGTKSRSPGSRAFFFAALVVLFVVHNDFWRWDDRSLVLGLPVGLAYHVGFCAAVSLLFWGIVRSGATPERG